MYKHVLSESVHARASVKTFDALKMFPKKLLMVGKVIIYVWNGHFHET